MSYNDFKNLEKRIELELTKHFRMKTILKITIDYFDINRATILGKSQIAPVVYVRYMIIYLASVIYGIDGAIISKYLRYKPRPYKNVIHLMKEKLRSEARMHSDLENIRAELVKVLNK